MNLVRRRLLTTFLIALWLAACSSFCLADHSLAVYGEGSGPSGGTANFQFSTSGSSGDSIQQDGSFSGNGTQTASTFAQVVSSGNFSNFIKLSSGSTNTIAGNLTPAGIATSVAGWSDTVILSGGGPYPDEIKIKFDVTGSLNGAINSDADPDNAWNDWASAFLAYNGAPGTFTAADLAQRNLDGGGIARLVLGSDDPPDGDPVFGWESLTVGVNGDFSGSFFLDVGPGLVEGEYDFAINFVAATTTQAGFANADIGNSVSLSLVADSNGIPLAGHNISFASGRSISAIPEPGAATFAVLSFICALTRRRRS